MAFKIYNIYRLIARNFSVSHLLFCSIPYLYIVILKLLFMRLLYLPHINNTNKIKRIKEKEVIRSVYLIVISICF